MIIYGYTTKGNVKGIESFACAKCGGNRCEVIEYKRYFTLFFIPLFPILKVGDRSVCITCKTVYMPQGTVVAETVVSNDTKATVVKRGLSFIIDSIVALILTVLLAEIVTITSATGGIYLLYTLSWLVYGTLCDVALSGRSLGKLIFNIGVRKDDGSELSFSTIILRNLVKAPLIFFTMPILAIVILVTKDRKSIHDMIAGTNVFDLSQIGERS